MYAICINLNGINYKKFISSFVVLTFLISLVAAPAGSQVLPIVGTSISASSFQPSVLLGLKIHPENPLLFDFIVDQGQSKLSTDELKEETTKIVKYFLAALTIPDKEVWANLSPTEKDRIIPDVLGQTTMGKTMLEQDYVLKQLAASLTNPDTDLGTKYWDNVNVNEGSIAVGNGRDRSLQNKVWIMPERAEVLESNGIVLVGEKRLKVMMDEEYQTVGAYCNTPLQKNVISSQTFRTIILPTIEKAVNEGKDFADVRQIYNSVILAAWYKKALKESLLGKIYTDKSKVAGVETNDKAMKQRIYEQYLAAFKKGAYSFIKEEIDESGELIPRKYFSGGIENNTTEILVVTPASPEQMESRLARRSTVSSATVELAEPADKEVVSNAALEGQDDSAFVASSSVNVELAARIINNLPNDLDILKRMLLDMSPQQFFAILEALIRAPEHEKYLTIEDLSDLMLARNSQLNYVGKNSLIDAIIRYKTKEKPTAAIPTMEYALDFLNEIKGYLAQFLTPSPLMATRKDLLGNDLGRLTTIREVLKDSLSGKLPQRTPEFYQLIYIGRKSLTDIKKRFDFIYATFEGIKALKSTMQERYRDPTDVAEKIIWLLAGTPAPRGKSVGDRLTITAIEAVRNHPQSEQVMQILKVKMNNPEYPNSEYLKALKLRLNSPAAASAPITPVGGIDFDPTNMNLQIKRNGRGVPLPLPQQNLQQINIQGLFPVIINISPINAQMLPSFLGQTPQGPQILTTTSG